MLRHCTMTVSYKHLAKVSQVGAACHTGNRTCFFNNIVKKEYVEKNPLTVLESEMCIRDRDNHEELMQFVNDMEFDRLGAFT